MIRQKKVGKSGSITLPKAMRANAGIFAGSAVDILQEGDTIIIAPHTKICRICGTAEDVVVKNGIGICRACAEDICKGA